MPDFDDLNLDLNQLEDSNENWVNLINLSDDLNEIYPELFEPLDEIELNFN